MNDSRNNKGFRHVLTASALLGVMFSAALFNVLHTRAGFDINLELEIGCGEGETKDCPKQCKVMFDTYLLNAQVWENRISNFANAMFQDVVGQLTKYAFCGVASKFSALVGAFGSGTIAEIWRKPDCTIGLTSGDISGMAKDAAKRTLLYDNVVRCQARDMLSKVTDGLNKIAQTGEGGGYVRDYTKLQTDAERKGRKIALNNMANTHYCPWIQLQMEAMFGFSKDEAKPLTDNTDNGAEPYTQRAECSFPPGTTAEQVAQMPEGLYLLSQPQNNILGAYLMAQEEIERQVTLQVEGQKTRAIAGQGHLGNTGTDAENSCALRDEQTGECLQDSPIIQSGAQVNNSVSNAQKAELDWIVTSNKMGQLMGDSVYRILNRAIDFTRRDIRFDFTPDQGQRLYSEGPDVSQVPEPSGPPPGGSCSEICGCPADEPVCECLANPTNPGYDAGKQIANSIKFAINKARLNNPQLFVNSDVNGNLLSGKVAEFVVQVCFELDMSHLGCRPYTPRADDVIIIPGGDVEYAIDIVTAAGKPRSNPTTKYSCDFGTFPGS